MRPFKRPTLVTLRRQQSDTAWGFRLGGGSEIGQPFQIQKVTAGSLAFLGGLSEGDQLVRIGNISLRGLTHDEVQQIILRCINCIDLFIVRHDGMEIEPRFELVLKVSNDDSVPNEIKDLEVFGQRRQVETVGNSFNNAGPINMTQVLNQQNSYAGGQQFQQPQQQQLEEQQVVFNRSAKPFQQNQSQPSEVNRQGNSSARDTRVFGVNARSPSKSPIRLNQSESLNEKPPSPIPTNQPFTGMRQSLPSTPTSIKQFSFSTNDFNNNPPNDDKKVFGLSAPRLASMPIAPMGNHGVQPITNEKKYFGTNLRLRNNSISCDRDWKSSLPIVNMPNTDQLLPSLTKQMQTYINQTPPTEKNLKPSLMGMERRRIRSVWPPPLPSRGHNRFNVEGRDSPSSKMFNWPPAGGRAQSVDRDFGYGERSMSPAMRYEGQQPSANSQLDRCESPYFNGRVIGSTKIWPPPSNATPAGRSGYIEDGDGEDSDNYAYNPNAIHSPGFVSPHVPQTYRPPPGNQHMLVNDF